MQAAAAAAARLVVLGVHVGDLRDSRGRGGATGSPDRRPAATCLARRHLDVCRAEREADEVLPVDSGSRPGKGLALDSRQPNSAERSKRPASRPPPRGSLLSHIKVRECRERVRDPEALVLIGDKETIDVPGRR